VLEIDRPQYQPDCEKEEWNNMKDPIKIFKQRLIEMGYLDNKTANRIAADAQNQIDEAYCYAVNSPEPSEDTLFQNIYA
jgi:pyruvate dehydrogenase E1 component alpha subunit